MVDLRSQVDVAVGVEIATAIVIGAMPSVVKLSALANWSVPLGTGRNLPTVRAAVPLTDLLCVRATVGCLIICAGS